MERQLKLWLARTLVLSAVIPAAVGAINYIMDPLWCFAISNRFNARQKAFNDRVQKTNYLTYIGIRDYDGLIISDSTGITFNPRHFRGIRVFNYSCHGLDLREFAPYVKYAKKINGRPFRYLFVGLNLAHASSNINHGAKPPETIIAESNRFLYRIKTIVSLDTLSYSLVVFQNYLKGSDYYADRDLIMHAKAFPPEIVRGHVKGLMPAFAEGKVSLLGGFQYNAGYTRMLRELRDDNPDTTFIVFTTPAVDPFLAEIVRWGRLDDYARWIADTVAVFGESYHFLYPTAISRDYERYFIDVVHPQPRMNDIMIDRIFNNPIRTETDFGMYIDRNNLQERLAHLSRLMKNNAARAAAGK